MITGFRWDLKGAQNMYNLDPDISTFGKAMANGFSVSAVCGKKKFMELGSIEKKGEERVFLLSTTHGAEMSGLGAFVETFSFLKSRNVIAKNWNYGSRLIYKSNKIAEKLKIKQFFHLSGVACSPFYVCKDQNYKISPEFKTLFMQEMLKNKVLIPWISIAYRHQTKEFDITMEAIENSLNIYKKALKNGVKRYLKGPPVKPVFRRYN